ncbi:serine/threonine protein kinase [Streptomyces olivochromogenes]|uniref:Serine/threonine protein kinase n=1 Tax=Streptomyces olivochromogenes TaxID=1963 RepID=A0A250VVV1_STROL|nr:serine/threonine protein kinase [Streptomyces olivochromogenes]
MLGAGGMGTVYAAVGERGERVAVKVVHAGQAADEQFRARFRREVQVLGRVSGPCLVPLLEADPEAETPWLATAYVPGLTLAQHAAAHGPLAGIQLHLFAAGAAGALAAVHAVGVVHRDLKPANVILAPDGPRVLDFGIAHVADGTAVTRTGMLTGTPGWLSPEYYRDGTAGPPGDVFAWGALLAFAATGRHPFGTGNAEAVAFRVLNGEPDLAGVPDELAGVVESCLAKDPAHRPSSSAVAEKTVELLGEQATQVLGAFYDRPTEVPNLLAEQWHPPTVEDPAWPIPATRRPISRAWLTVIAAAVFAASATGTWFALAPGHAQARGDQPLRVTAARSTPAAGPAASNSPIGRPAASAPSHTPAAAVSSVQATQTQVVTISPWSPDGTPAGGITITGRASGSCFGTAESTMRTDAWRCSAGNRILDPCFSPDSNPEDTSALCLDGAPNRMVELSVPQGFPGNNDHMPGGPDVEPITLVLSNGARCSFTGGGTSTLAGQRLNYGCDNGGYLYGYPNKTAALWTISYSAPNSGASVSTPITTVYQ